MSASQCCINDFGYVLVGKEQNAKGHSGQIHHEVVEVFDYTVAVVLIVSLGDIVLSDVCA